MATNKTRSYQSLSEELDAILSQLQTEDTDIETAVKAYERGMALVAELEKQLKNAQNRVKKIKLNFEQ